MAHALSTCWYVSRLKKLLPGRFPERSLGSSRCFRWHRVPASAGSQDAEFFRIFDHQVCESRRGGLAKCEELSIAR